MLVTSISAAADEFAGFCSSSTMVPLTAPKWPRTVLIIRCLSENSTVVCAGSMFQVVVVVLSAMLIVLSPFGLRLRWPLHPAAAAVGRSGPAAFGVAV